MIRFLESFGIDTEVAGNTARIRDAFLNSSIPRNLAVAAAINKKMNPESVVTYHK